MNRILILCTLLLGVNLLLAQPADVPRLPFDVLHYDFELELFDDTDKILGLAQIDVLIKENTPVITLDLMSTDAGGGMEVARVEAGQQKSRFTHRNNLLAITSKQGFKAGDTLTLRVEYAGVPADGLIIAKNKFDQRTFFGDNWPNRARHWLPMVDHPTDKATVRFGVTAPDYLQVVANGEQVEEINLSQSKKYTAWQSEQALPTKVMVIGAAPFAVKQVGKVDGVPITSWVYPENRAEGYADYSLATKVLPWFIEKFGPYPYPKLANVQSKTRYGGMENASSIFYFENSVTGTGAIEDLIAHEIAHQWFGNQASEGSWYHLWLSEGFATYLTNAYWEATYGKDAMRERLAKERGQIIAFSKKYKQPVVDTSVTDFNTLLNPNSYQKGGWFLHMLRHRVGEEAFWSGLRTYYDNYKGNNALTDDFRQIMEAASGQKLADFFQQWLYEPGHPYLEVDWGMSGNVLELTIRQPERQDEFPLTMEARMKDGRKRTVKALIKARAVQTIRYPNVGGEVETLILDPEVKLLFEGKVQRVDGE